VNGISEENFLQALTIFEGLRIENIKLRRELDAAHQQINELTNTLKQQEQEDGKVKIVDNQKS